MEWFLKVIKNFSFQGRARRKEYWMYALFVTLIAVVLSLIDLFAGTYSASIGLGLLSGLFSLATLIQGIAVCVRRLHDLGKSGWWLLIMLIPLIGPIVILVFMVLDGQPGENQYGPNPKTAS